MDITVAKKESIQTVLDEFVEGGPQVVSCGVNPMPDGRSLAGYPIVEASQEPAADSARALKEMQKAATGINWGDDNSITIETDSFNLHMFVIADGKAYVGVAVPRDVTLAIIKIAFDKSRDRFEDAMPWSTTDVGRGRRVGPSSGTNVWYRRESREDTLHLACWRSVGNPARHQADLTRHRGEREKGSPRGGGVPKRTSIRGHSESWEATTSLLFGTLSMDVRLGDYARSRPLGWMT